MFIELTPDCEDNILLSSPKDPFIPALTQMPALETRLLLKRLLKMANFDIKIVSDPICPFVSDPYT